MHCHDECTANMKVKIAYFIISLTAHLDYRQKAELYEKCTSLKPVCTNRNTHFYKNAYS